MMRSIAQGKEVGAAERFTNEYLMINQSRLMHIEVTNKRDEEVLRGMLKYYGCTAEEIE